MISDAFMFDITSTAAKFFELLGIAVIIAGTVLAMARLALSATGLKQAGILADKRDPIAAFRATLGRSILTGLELLVAADIIRTVAVEPTLENVAVLAIVVAIRTFLSFSLEVEIDGRWPWQKRNAATETK